MVMVSDTGVNDIGVGVLLIDCISLYDDMLLLFHDNDDDDDDDDDDRLLLIRSLVLA